MTGTSGWRHDKSKLLTSDWYHVSGVYAVLGRRRARVVREEMREGSDLFSIHAYLPAQASFGFANDMRRQSSGVRHDGHVHIVF